MFDSTAENYQAGGPRPAGQRFQLAMLLAGAVFAATALLYGSVRVGASLPLAGDSLTHFIHEYGLLLMLAELVLLAAFTLAAVIRDASLSRRAQKKVAVAMRARDH